MTRSRAKTYVRFFVVFAVLGTLGLVSSVYVLIHERLALPFQKVYTIKAAFTEANGIIGGIGQPVDVVGVNVGQVSGVQLANGTAIVTMQLQRSRVSHLYQNATATLEPITPLQNMQINLDPGHPPAGPMRPGATIGIGQTSAPVPASDLLSTLDSDTRTYLASLIASFDEGTAGRAADMRHMLLALGPTTAQLGQITTALKSRDQALAHFIHNLAVVTRASSQDQQMAAVVSAGNQTLRAFAEQDQPLRAAIAAMPGTLSDTRSTLVRLEPFANTLGGTLTALLPAVRRSPAALDALGSLANTGAHALRGHVGPLVSEAQPLLHNAGLAVAGLRQATPNLTGSAQTLDYFLNELAYHPPGDGEGFLFWWAWAAHNLNSVLSAADAHGSIDRAMYMVECNGLQQQHQLQQILGVVGLCPK